MGSKIRRVDYFSMQARDMPGEGARLLKQLQKAKVDLLAFTGFPSSAGSQIDFVPAKSEKFKAAAKKLGLKVSRAKSGFLAQGKDKTGVVADILGKLGKAKINVTAIDAVAAGKKRFGAIFWVKPADVATAGKALKAKGG
ncbi:MAG: hypothetical protein ACRETN_04335 [Nevskiales bacterium]